MASVLCGRELMRFGQVLSVIDPADGQPVEYSIDTLLSADDYVVV